MVLRQVLKEQAETRTDPETFSSPEPPTDPGSKRSGQKNARFIFNLQTENQRFNVFKDGNCSAAVGKNTSIFTLLTVWWRFKSHETALFLTSTHTLLGAVSLGPEVKGHRRAVPHKRSVQVLKRFAPDPQNGRRFTCHRFKPTKCDKPAKASLTETIHLIQVDNLGLSKDPHFVFNDPHWDPDPGVENLKCSLFQMDPNILFSQIKQRRDTRSHKMAPDK